MENTLYYGDNLDILKRYIKDESVDLVYLDPPFNSNKDYNILFKERNGKGAAAEIKAFEDSWCWDEAAYSAYCEVTEMGGNISRLLQGLHIFLGTSNMLAYLSMMAPRLIELHRVLKSTGSIYLHCDPTASHYLKLLMDAVFEVENFQNEIIWQYHWGLHITKRWNRKHDTVFMYSKKPSGFVFNANEVREPYASEGGYTTDLRYNPKYDKRGKLPEDVWYIPTIQGWERLGYPTQKPEKLLERIIKASSNEGDVVLDPFCGCGTAIAVAEKLNRKWIGIDITHLAVALMKHRLSKISETFAIKPKYEVIGEPVSLPDAEALAADDPFQFQFWSLSLVAGGAVPVVRKKGPDKGIDGELFFHDDQSGKTKQILFSVKAGKSTGKWMIDELKGNMDKHKSDMGVLILMHKPDKPMRKYAMNQGYFKSPWGNHPKIQIITAEELLEGKDINYPVFAINVTRRK